MSMEAIETPPRWTTWAEPARLEPLAVRRAPEEPEFSFVSKEERLDIAVANSLPERRRAYRFMRWIYAERGWGRPHSSGMHYSLHELLPDSVTLTVLRAGDLVATLTLVVDSPLGLPDDEGYQDVLDRQRLAGRRLAQIVSLGVRDDVRGNADILVNLFNYAYFVARGLKGATDFVITVLPHHTAFYRRKMLFEVMGETRWQKKTGVAVDLLKLDFDVAERATVQAHTENTGAGTPGTRTIYHQFCTVQEGADTVAALAWRLQPIALRSLDYFLTRKPELLHGASAIQKTYIADYRRHAAMTSGSRSPSAVRAGETRAVESDFTAEHVAPGTFNLLRWKNTAMVF